MKKGIFSKMVFVSMVAGAIIATPMPALSTSLTPISSYSFENNSQSGPENIIDTIGNWFGVDLIGPSGLGVTFSGDNITASTGASGFQQVSWQFWNYGSTQTAINQYSWAAIYQLSGDPAMTADISLDYTYKNHHLNTVADGRSQSKSSAALFYNIVPASMAGEYSQSAADALFNFIYPNPFSSQYDAPERWDYSEAVSLSYDKNYYMAALTWGDDTTTGSVPFVSMGVGDQLYLLGYLVAETQAQVYGPGVSIATMVSTLKTDFTITETPLSAFPEPSTILLLGTGLLGLAVIGRKQRPDMGL